MASAKKRKIVYEGGMFNKDWENSYFFVEISKKPVSLVCGKHVAAMKKSNLQRHFDSCHGNLKKLTAQTRQDKKIDVLKREGYELSLNGYEETIQQTNCTNFTNTISEHLHSPGYPNKYFENLDCRKVIKAGPQFTINLKFMIFHLEASQECQYDYIEIRDGMYGFSPLLFRGCGDDVRQGTIFKSTGQYMWIRFVSDGQISRKGFLAKISAGPQTESSNKEESFACYSLVEGVSSFEINSASIPRESMDFYVQHPEEPIDCIWDIRLPVTSKVLSRIYNYSIEHLTANCDSNYLAFYDMSTASSDVQQKECRSVYLPYISKNWRTIVRLHAHSIRTLPEFRLLGNIYWPTSAGNCTHESMVNCFDGYCIPTELRCDSYENCREGYDEDCTLASDTKSFNPKYITLFAVVIVGSIVLTTLMTLVEVLQKQRSAREEARRKSSSTSSSTTLKSASHTSHISLQNTKQRPVNSPCTERSMSVAAGSVTAGSATDTFTSSRLNENVSFRKPSTPVVPRLVKPKHDGNDRIYAMPHITLPPTSSMAKLPPAPPTPPPPPIPVDEGKGFRLIYDLTHMGNAANFEYPPPPSFVEHESTDYSSTSSSSFGSLPRDQHYDVACLGPKRKKPTHLKVEVAVEPSQTEPLFQPAQTTPKASKFRKPIEKKCWTFDDDTDDGAMELTTYISTC
ncbi:neuropilin and tolloid-like protein 2 [Watersipora subatra]|uniref:neuropilin and tolloid-like protein 2 n=1 Tax=Watersipora subatra TaxID=2589382 RepID=UPI00355C1F3F